MAAVDQYPFALFIHMLGALALCIGLAIEWLAIVQLRQQASDRVVSWNHALSLARRLGPLGMALLLIPGVLMTFTRWNFAAWPAAGLIGMAGIVVVGLVTSRRPNAALHGIQIRFTIAIGVVAVMVFKPDLVSSLLMLGAAAALGAGVSLIAHGGPHDRGSSRKLQPGSALAHLQLETISGDHVSIPDAARLIHLQFRRFAGCPVCNLHLHSIVRRHAEIMNASVREVVVFHSSREELLVLEAGLPFAVVADPHKHLYQEFGVEASPRALLDARVWLPILLGVARSAVGILTEHRRAPSLKPTGGRLGLPADFLIGCDGRVLAVKYGSHAYDQWSVDELLALTRSGSRSTAATIDARPRSAMS